MSISEGQSKQMKWQPKSNRFVAFFDILGFKERVMRESHDETFELLKTINGATSLIENRVNSHSESERKDTAIYIVTFSDSIIMFSKNDNEDSFSKFMLSANVLFAFAMKEGIPLKGGIAHGEITVHKEKKIYFGQPIIDAYLLEEELYYFGVSAHYSINAYIDKNKRKVGRIVDEYLIEFGAPLKCGKVSHYNLNWFREIGGQKVFKLVKGFYKQVSGKPRRYVDNTLSVLEKIKL